MKGGKTANGYTIVEIMIFLAVTGALFMLAMITINGQQAKADFAQGTRDFQSQVDDVINDIQNGNFPAPSGNFTCTASAGSAPSFTGGSPGDTGLQGTHDKCVYFGKIAQFSTGSDVTVSTVVAKRQSASGLEPATFTDARPIVPTGAAAMTEKFTLSGGIKVTQIKVKKGGNAYDVGAIGFVNSFTKNTENNGLVNVLPIFGTDLSAATTGPSSVSGIVNGSVIAGSWILTRAANDSNPDVIIICLRQNGPGGQRAGLFIGDAKSKSSTNLHIGDLNSATTAVVGGFTCPA